MISLSRPEIEALIDLPVAAAAIRAAYRAAARGTITLPPVGHITFPDHDADCHIKYGHVHGDPSFVIKVATGFPRNAGTGLPTGNGLVLVMSAETGQVQAVLQDEMMLTDIRTGLGGAIASRLLARSDSHNVLIVGTGPQARRQIEAHAALFPHDLRFEVWGRNPDRTDALVAALSGAAEVTRAKDLETATGRADIVVTATGANTPFLRVGWVHPGTHITAVGADAPGKQELDVALVARADVLAVDLAAQCLDHGEVSHAARSGTIRPDAVQELGTLLDDPSLGRTAPDQITIADLTGLAAQDIAMANAILTAWHAQNG